MKIVHKNKTIIFFIGLLLILVTGITYSRYYSTANTDSKMSIAPWSIKINGQDVSKTYAFTLNNIIWSEETKVANGYIAPGGNGYYSIEIDPSGTEVAIDYTIGLDATTFEDYTGLAIEKVTIDGEEVTGENGYYDGFISLEDVLNNKKVDFRIYIAWKESGDQIDTEIGVSYQDISLPIVAAVKQHIEGTDSSSFALQPISYKETLLEVERPDDINPNPYYSASFDALYKNPERGFYNTYTLRLKESGNQIRNAYSKVSQLVYLKIDLSPFSKTTNKVEDKELTEDALNTIDAQLEYIKQNNNTAILRFLYDNSATGIVEGVEHFEPEQEMILRHIEQLSAIFQKYSSTIYTIQVGFYGLWGENYYNTTIQDHPEYFKQTGDALLKATEGTEITISFRTPNYYTKYRQLNGIEDLANDVTTREEDAYRIGIFNDGYLASNNDVGTFKNRELEINWLKKQTNHTSYGGEALPASSGYEDWNLIRFTEDEMFKTHTSYLNFEWNQQKHYIWANQVYDGKDEAYEGRTALEYIQNHLGYRLVVRMIELPKSMEVSSKMLMNISIENVGFGNVIKSKTATLIFVNEEGNIVKESDITKDFNIKDFTSQDTVTKSLEVDTSDLSSGNYRIYLRISNEQLNDGTYYNAIRFANNEIWDSNLQANRIGKIKIN